MEQQREFSVFDLRAKDWNQVREGLEVRLCPAPGGEEVFLLCRSAQRKEKEQAMHERFEKRIAEGLEKIVASCAKRKQLPAVIDHLNPRFSNFERKIR